MGDTQKTSTKQDSAADCCKTCTRGTTRNSGKDGCDPAPKCDNKGDMTNGTSCDNDDVFNKSSTKGCSPTSCTREKCCDETNKKCDSEDKISGGCPAGQSFDAQADKCGAGDSCTA